MTDEEDFDLEDQPISKSQIKRELHALKDLAEKLIELSEAQLKKLPVSEEFTEEVIRAKSFKRKALKRQIQRLGALIQHEDIEQLQREYERLLQPHREDVRAMHEIEQWRDQLLQGNDVLLSDLINRYDQANRQHLRQLIRNAKKETEQNKPPKSSRLLFQYLKELRES